MARFSGQIGAKRDESGNMGSYCYTIAVMVAVWYWTCYELEGIVMELGERLKANRLNQGISQAELTRRLDVPRSTIWRWENGKAVPSPLYEHKLKQMNLLP